ncbi:MAG: 5-formyltetrahydrofolate cyclo-ligase [Verrucomicrobiota bacterium]
MTISTAFNNKRQLRTEIRRQLRANSLDSGPVCEAARCWLAARPELRTVALFAALAQEVDLLPLVAWDPNRCWVFPRVCGQNLVWHEVRDVGHDFVSGTLGISEPMATLPVVQVCAVDVFLCPGLAFDENGGRLGRGGGFYDRMLVGVRSAALKVGICHPVQRVSDTFPEPHDIPMDAVIS